MGGLGATPIINKPEVGILGVHNAKDRAVVKDGHVVEAGLTDQVLDDPQHGYTQLLVSSVLQV